MSSASSASCSALQLPRGQVVRMEGRMCKFDRSEFVAIVYSNSSVTLSLFKKESSAFHEGQVELEGHNC